MCPTTLFPPDLQERHGALIIVTKQQAGEQKKDVKSEEEPSILPAGIEEGKGDARAKAAPPLAARDVRTKTPVATRTPSAPGPRDTLIRPIGAAKPAPNDAARPIRRPSPTPAAPASQEPTEGLMEPGLATLPKGGMSPLADRK